MIDAGEPNDLSIDRSVFSAFRHGYQCFLLPRCDCFDCCCNLLIVVSMENSVQEAMTSATAPALVAMPAAGVDSSERCGENKQKFYKQHFLALSDRCEIIQQVQKMKMIDHHSTYPFLCSKWTNLGRYLIIITI